MLMSSLAMMIAETVNNVFGRTVNPRNRKLTSGGSSGGESALIAFGGSRIGVGTDIGKLELAWTQTLILIRARYHRRLPPHPRCLHRHLHHPPFLWPLS